MVLGEGPKSGRSWKQGEFLRITESAPLVQPSQVVVETRDVQFAQPVLSSQGTFFLSLYAFLLQLLHVFIL